MTVKKQNFKKWAISFSITTLKLIAVSWTIFLFYSAVIIAIAVFKTGELSSLDTFISEISETFRASVVTVLITRTVGNIFQYNNGKIFGESIGEEDE